MYITYLFNFVDYVFYCCVYLFLLLFMFYSVYSHSLCCSVYCLFVNVYLLPPPGVNPIAVNKYNLSYHIYILSLSLRFL
jgi:hypothetical protein